MEIRKTVRGTCLHGTNGDTDIENGLADIAGEGDGGMR